MDLNQMLTQLDALTKLLDGKSNDLQQLSRQITQLVDNLSALDGGTGNANTRRALQTLRNAGDRCRAASVPVMTARVKSLAYIGSVRS